MKYLQLEEQHSCSLQVEDQTFTEQFGVIELIFHKNSRKRTLITVSKISDDQIKIKNALLPNYQNFTIMSSWKKFARVGFTKGQPANFINCKTRKGDALPGLRILEGIIYVSDPTKISRNSTNPICLGPGSPVKIMTRAVPTCNSRRWCSEYEDEEECEDACHAVTGEVRSVTVAPAIARHK